MKIAAFEFDGEWKLGAVEGHCVADLERSYALYLHEIRGDAQALDVARVRIPRDLLTFLRGGEPSWEAARQGLEHVSSKGDVRGLRNGAIWRDLAEVRLLAPLVPETVLCAGPNLDPGSGMDLERHREFYLKSAHTVIGPQETVLHQRGGADKLLCETELGIVLGGSGRYLSPEEAEGIVFGYTVFTDVYDAEKLAVGWEGWHFHNLYGEGASFDTAAPIGPWVVTKDEVGDPAALEASLSVNGSERARYCIGDLQRGVFEFVSYLSTFFTLEPGILIASGSPAGARFGTTPDGLPVILNDAVDVLSPDDRIRSAITGIGVLENPVTRE
ncbi:MAG: fumarylacetoacetate hydrolase family protein [Nitrospinota bacterium]